MHLHALSLFSRITFYIFSATLDILYFNEQTNRFWDKRKKIRVNQSETDEKTSLQRSAWPKRERGKAVQITGIQDFEHTAFAWLPCPEHDHAS